jgi:hypothetical protein
MSLVSGPPFGYEYPPSIDGTRRQFYNGNRIPNLFDIKRQIFERYQTTDIRKRERQLQKPRIL